MLQEVNNVRSRVVATVNLVGYFLVRETLKCKGILATLIYPLAVLVDHSRYSRYCRASERSCRDGVFVARKRCSGHSIELTFQLL